MSHTVKRGLAFFLCLVMAFSLTLAFAPAADAAADGGQHWVATWHEAILNVKEGSQAEKAINSIEKLSKLYNVGHVFSGSGQATFRIQMNTQLAGRDFQMKLSNRYGTGDIQIEKITVGFQGNGALSTLDTGSKIVTAASNITIAKGGSKTVSFSFSEVIPAGTSLCINILCKKDTCCNVRDFALTGGTSWFQGGDQTTEAELSDLGNVANLCSLVTTNNGGEGDYNLIPLLEELDVKASADTYAVMFIGDSTITNSIPDMLLDNLQRNGIHNVSVVSSAIKGNELLQDGAGSVQGPLEGDALITRFKHDALEVAGVQKIFVKIGTNDILHPQLSDLKDWYNGSSTRPDGYTPTAEQMSGGYQNLIDQAKAAGKELYFMDINPFIGYTRDGSLTWTKDFTDQVNPIRLAVNAWLADNQSQYAGYIPCTAKIGEDVTIGGTVYPLGQIAKRYTTDWVHPSPAGMQAEADLIPITYFKAVSTPAANQAAVTNIWVATNEMPTNGKWLIASNSGKNVKDTAGQQGTVHLLATDTQYTSQITSTNNSNPYNQLGDVTATIQRGTAAAPYVAPGTAVTGEKPTAVWTRYGYGTRIYWKDSYFGRFLSYYYPSPASTGTVSEFNAGLRDAEPEHAFLTLSGLKAQTNSNEWFTLGNTSSTAWGNGDPWELSMHFGASASGQKYLAWDSTSSSNSSGTKFRVYNSNGSKGFEAGENGNGTITYLSELAAVNTQLDVTQSQNYTCGEDVASGTIVPVGFRLTDDLLNVETTKTNATQRNETSFTADGSQNVQDLRYTGYTYGQNQTLTCVSDNKDVAYYDAGCVKLGSACGTATLTWTYGWDELDGTHYAMTVTTTVTRQGATFTVVHSSDNSSNTFYVKDNPDFNLTEQVRDGYLYGGTFTDGNYQTAFSGDPTHFTPAAGATYYVQEVAQKYLSPNDYDVWQHTADGQKHVTGLYMLAAVDSTRYREVGFTVNGEDRAVNEVYGVINVTKGTTPYQVIYVSDGVLNASGAKSVPNHDDGYIAMLALQDLQTDFFTAAGKKVTFQPYWITLDGVKVTGSVQRECTYLGTGADSKYEWVGFWDSKAACDPVYVGSQTETAMLSFRAAKAFESDPETLAAQTVTITVNENGSVTTVNLDKGDLTGKLTPAGADGKVFAGWYTDEACTVPADFSDVQSDMTVYAKYVSGAYLSVKYKQVGVFRVRSVTLLSAVDSKDYQDSGYIINGEQVSCTNYKNRYGIITARMIFGRDVSRSAQLMTYSYATTGLTKGDTIEIVPYWVTLDGTLVTGTARTLTYNVRGLNG